MPPHRKLKLGEAWRSLAPGQGFRLFTIAVVLLAAAAVLGALVTGGHDQRHFVRKEDRVETLIGNLRKSNGELDQQFADLTIRESELLKRHAALEASLTASRADRRALAGEAEFLHRYIAYMGIPGGGAPSEGSPSGARLADAKPPDTRPADPKPAEVGPAEVKPASPTPQEARGNPKPLVDTLCTLRTGGDKQFVRFESGPLLLTAQDFEQGHMPLDVQTLLVENFVSLDPIQQIRLADAAQGGKPGKPIPRPPASANSTSAPLMASVMRQAQSIKILKSISFLDGARYEIPRNIAVALQIRRECLPH